LYGGPLFSETRDSYSGKLFGRGVIVDSINLRWWEIFDDEILDTMVKTALVYNLDVKMAAARIEQARAYWGMTKADIWPSIDISAGAARGNYGGGMRDSFTSNQFYVTPRIVMGNRLLGQIQKVERICSGRFVCF
jgi:multidrug efflux system outer membrane protein